MKSIDDIYSEIKWILFSSTLYLLMAGFFLSYDKWVGNPFVITLGLWIGKLMVFMLGLCLIYLLYLLVYLLVVKYKNGRKTMCEGVLCQSYSAGEQAEMQKQRNESDKAVRYRTAEAGEQAEMQKQRNETEEDDEITKEEYLQWYIHDTGGKGEEDDEITKEEYIAFIGKNADKYMKKINKFEHNGVERFSLTWHWPAFIFSIFWLIYRKFYGWAFLVFIFILLISVFNFAAGKGPVNLEHLNNINVVIAALIVIFALWLLYKKLYSCAFIAILSIGLLFLMTSPTPGRGVSAEDFTSTLYAIFVSIPLGISANYMYYKKAQKKIKELKETKGNISENEWYKELDRARGKL